MKQKGHHPSVCLLPGVWMNIEVEVLEVAVMVLATAASMWREFDAVVLVVIAGEPGARM